MTKELVEAIKIVLEKEASTACLQINMLIGYNKANKLMAEMEKLEVVSKSKGILNRDVLISDISQLSQKNKSTDTIND